MLKNLPKKLISLAERLPAPLYIVGGVCRDALLQNERAVKDWDICAPVDARKLCEAAESVCLTPTAVYAATGTVRLEGDGEKYEFTSFRTDSYRGGLHRPSSVEFTDSIEKDARRRDFTCNAVYYDVKKGEFVDVLGGIKDIKAGVLNTVDSPYKVFGEDGLRLMRLCRFAATLGFTPEEECLVGARANAALIDDVAKERVWEELKKILSADSAYGVKGGHYAGVKLLYSSGVMRYILPELTAGDGMAQRKDYHNYDVLGHSLRCVYYAPENIRLAALLHDVGKPYCYNKNGSFAGHETEGARITADILTRLKAPVKEREYTEKLVLLHMYDFTGAAAENKVRKFLVNNWDVIPDLLALKQADFSACKDVTSPAPVNLKWQNIIEKMQKEGVPFTQKQLNIRGDHLIACGILPAQTGKTLKFLLEQAAMNCVKNERESLIKSALRFNGR